MDKADKRALESLPKRKDGRTRLYHCNDDDVRKVYARGYRRAEKDLTFTPDDIKFIIDKYSELPLQYGPHLFDEILQQFNKTRK